MEEIQAGYWVIANHKHLREFKEDAPNRDEFEATDLAGKVGLFLGLIRGHGRVPIKRAVDLARRAQIPKAVLLDSVLPNLRKATDGRIDYDASGSNVTTVEEHVDTESTLFKATSDFYNQLGPSDIDRSSLETLSYTATLPRSQTEAVELLQSLGVSEDRAQLSLKIQEGFGLVKVFKEYGLSEPVVFNEYIWRCDLKKLAHFLGGLPKEHKEIIENILTVCESYQARPAESFPYYGEVITMADSVGLLDVVMIKSADGEEKGFLFTPHLRSEDSPTEFSNDLLGDVKLFLAAMGFGETYSKISRLGDADREKTINFIAKLIREGEAGDATAIGVDYVMLEERGIIRVEPTPTPPGSRYKMVLLRPNVAKLALKIIKASVETPGSLLLPLRSISPKNLEEGRQFTDVEAERIQRAAHARLPAETQEARNYYLKKLRGEV